MKIKNLKTSNFLFSFSVIVFLFLSQSAVVYADNIANEKGSIKFENGDISEGLNKLIKSVPPPNPLGNQEGSEYASSVSYPFSPFSKFDITFDQKNKKGFHANTPVVVKGSFGYSNNSLSEINKIIQDCQAKYSNFEDEKRNIICAAPPIYEIPSFSDVGVFAQVWKVDTDRERERKNGDYLIDEFYVAEGLDINVEERKDFIFKWKAPEKLENGDYYISFFINSYKRFSLLSIPINTFSPVSRFDFNIREESDSKNIFIDKETLKINGKNYSPIHPAPIVEPLNKSISIDFPVINPNKEEQKVKIKYELFRWTEEDHKNLLKTEETTKTIGTENASIQSFKFEPNKNESLYDLRITATSPQGVKSMTNIHFSIKNHDRGIFTYLGMARREESLYPMFCLRDAQWEGLFEGKVKISISDSKKITSVWEKDGFLEPQDGRCFVILNNNFKKSANAFEQEIKLSGEIFNKTGEKVDQIEIVHNSDSKSTLATSNFYDKWKTFLVLSSAILLILLIILIYYKKNPKNKKNVKKNIKR